MFATWTWSRYVAICSLKAAERLRRAGAESSSIEVPSDDVRDICCGRTIRGGVSARVRSRARRGRPPAGGLGTNLTSSLAVVDAACEATLCCTAAVALSPRSLEASSTLLDLEAANRSVMFSSSRATCAVWACNRCSICENDSREERLP